MKFEIENVEPRRMRVVTGYAAHARLSAEMGDPIGYTARLINGPYVSSPTHAVYALHGQAVIVVETRHRRYEVFALPSGSVIESDDKATARFIARQR
jgi:hypothetical protein